MSEYLKKEDQKKKTVKQVIQDLHKGLSAEEAKKRIEEEAGTLTSTEIADIEQSLIDEGMPVEEIKKFCNVHALLFESSLSGELSRESSESHPLYLFGLENDEIGKLIDAAKGLMSRKSEMELGQFKNDLAVMLSRLKGIELHYTRKEQVLFPYLEKYGFMGPSKVMWGKHNEIRKMLKDAVTGLEKVNADKKLKPYLDDKVSPLIEEIEGMIFKEENILFPTSKEKLSVEDWVGVLKESEEVGYAFIEGPKETSSMIEELKKADTGEAILSGGGEIKLPTGILEPEQLMRMLNSLPVELTFIDKDDSVRYFSDNEDRVFVRTKSVIGRKVQNCHPPQSVDIVEKILSDFKKGKRSHADFWIRFRDRMIFIQFVALKDGSSKYLGTLEMTMDITDIRELKGEKRLLDEKDRLK